jgi:glycosyltransferase involved in cell wall biosynthesis
MITLSYIIATRNRFPFLKITLDRLINNLESDEEIVVVDGNSTDETKQYLNNCLKEGKIHQYISEPDKNQAHAWNKAMLLAKGTIIKKIIDDDVFCLAAIRKCKDYMLQNTAIDVVISNDLSSSLLDYKTITPNSRLQQFEKWKNKINPSFTFGDVHMLVRKSSLAYIGLYNTSFIMMDWEYSLRITYLQANIAYYSGFNALNVFHPQNVSSLKNEKLAFEQGKRAEIFFEYAGDKAEISLWSRVKIFIGNIVFRKKDQFKLDEINFENLEEIYETYYLYINSLNNIDKYEFYNCWQS